MAYSKREDQEDVTIEFDEIVRDEPGDAATLYNFSGEEIWIPKSQISHEDLSADGSGSICIPRWLASKKGLE